MEHRITNVITDLYHSNSVHHTTPLNILVTTFHCILHEHHCHAVNPLSLSIDPYIPLIELQYLYRVHHDLHLQYLPVLDTVYIHATLNNIYTYKFDIQLIIIQLYADQLISENESILHNVQLLLPYVQSLVHEFDLQIQEQISDKALTSCVEQMITQQYTQYIHDRTAVVSSVTALCVVVHCIMLYDGFQLSSEAGAVYTTLLNQYIQPVYSLQYYHQSNPYQLYDITMLPMLDELHLAVATSDRNNIKCKLSMKQYLNMKQPSVDIPKDIKNTHKLIKCIRNSIIKRVLYTIPNNAGGIGQRTILSLPNELQLHILSYLNSHDLMQISYTNSYVHNLCYSSILWQQLCMTELYDSTRTWPKSDWYNEYITRYLLKQQHAKQLQQRRQRAQLISLRQYNRYLPSLQNHTDNDILNQIMPQTNPTSFPPPIG